MSVCLLRSLERGKLEHYNCFFLFLDLFMPEIYQIVPSKHKKPPSQIFRILLIQFGGY